MLLWCVGEDGDTDEFGYSLNAGCSTWDCADEGGVACFEEVFCFIGVDSWCYSRN